MTKPSRQQLQIFFNALNEITAIPESELEYTEKFIETKTFKKNQHLVRAGERLDSYYFICNGLVRFYYLCRDGKEFNKHFAMENDFAGSIATKVLGIPSIYGIQALEDTETLVIKYDLLDDLYNRDKSWERMGRLTTEKLAILKEFREKSFLLDDAETRYRNFIKQYPALMNRISLFHIASYIGITQVALSRIRKNLT